MSRVCVLLALIGACSSPPSPHHAPLPQAPQKKAGAVTLTIIGTNDLHGALDRLPILGGYLANVRAARAKDGGGVVVVDAGDMFQGTLESNLAEGADVVRAYNQLAYAASAIGNHEFDYGPAGPAVTAATIEDDARGALKQRAKEAKFPLLVANIVDKKSGERIKWPNMPPSVVVTAAGVKVGIIGVSTESTPFTTMPANFADLAVTPPAPAIADEARALRAKGAQVIVVTAHIGSSCKDLEHPADTSSCKKDEELFHMVSDLPKGLVDVIVAGHTHAGIAHRIDDIAVIESFSSGRAFGRVDLRIAPDGHVTSAKISPPRALCQGEGEGNPIAAADCKPGEYEGSPVFVDREIAAIVSDAQVRAQRRRDEKLGVTLTGVVAKSYGNESAVGNLFTDLMLAARPDAQVALTNGGGLRADLPAGELTYGQLYEAMPFDNRFAIVDVKGAHIRRLVTTNLQRGGGFNSWGGIAVKARCKGSTLDVAITVGKKPLADAASYKLVTSDFLASGGDGLIGRLKLPDGAIKMTDVIIRDAIADILRKRKGAKIDPAQLFAPPATRRLDYEGNRPVECGKIDGKKPDTEPPD